MESNYLKYDCHCHSIYSSCSIAKVKDMFKHAAKKSLDGIAITDHNTIKAIAKAKPYAKKYGIDLIPGIEIHTRYCELLVYYIEEEPLHLKPYYKKINSTAKLNELLDWLKQSSLISIAHPFGHPFKRIDKRVVVSNIAKIDAVEVLNARARTVMPFSYAKACNFALSHGRAFTAGSDSHTSFEIGNAYTMFKVDYDLWKAVKLRKTFAKADKFYRISAFSGEAIATIGRLFKKKM